MSDLIIIGKGFDLVHDRETRYEHFRDYLYTKDKELVAALERFIDVPDLWQDFENNLALLDIHDIAEYAMELSATEDMYRPMNNSGGLHAAAHFSSICKQLVASFTRDLKSHMADWINKIDGPNDERLSCIENVDYAISFNYTKTLEHIYGVDRESTFYIHNTPGGEYYGFISVDRLCEIIDWSGIHLIFGHGARDREPQRFDNPIPSMTRDYDNNAAHFRLESAYELLNGFYEEAAKKTEAVIPELGHFLRYASDVKRVYIIGHSLSDVEMHYFQVNAGHFGSDVEYHVSYFATDDEEETERANLEYQVAQFLSKKARRAFYNLARPDCPLRHTANLDGQ